MSESVAAVTLPNSGEELQALEAVYKAPMALVTRQSLAYLDVIVAEREIRVSSAP